MSPCQWFYLPKLLSPCLVWLPEFPYQRCTRYRTQIHTYLPVALSDYLKMTLDTVIGIRYSILTNTGSNPHPIRVFVPACFHCRGYSSLYSNTCQCQPVSIPVSTPTSIPTLLQSSLSLFLLQFQSLFHHFSIPACIRSSQTALWCEAATATRPTAVEAQSVEVEGACLYTSTQGTSVLITSRTSPTIPPYSLNFFLKISRR